MNVKRYLYAVCMFSFISCFGFSFPSYSQPASSSNATGISSDDSFYTSVVNDYIPSEDGYNYEDEFLEDNEEYFYYDNTYSRVLQDEILKEILNNVEYISARLASASDALEAEEEIQEIESLEENFISPLSRSLPVSYSLPDHDVVRFVGTFGGTSYTLLIPRQYYSDLWVDQKGYLYNIGTANITGRMFINDSFSNTNYNYYNFTLTPLLGTSASTLYRYGAINYRTYYYASTSSTTLASTVTYGNFSVDEIDILNSVNVEYQMYYVLLSVLFVGGLIVLCLWKNSRQL